MPLDPDRQLSEELVLTTLEGAEDFLVSDLAGLDAVSGVRRTTGGVGCRLQGPLRELQANRLWSVAALPLPGAPHDEAFLVPLHRSSGSGVLAALDPGSGPLRFRVGAGPGEREALVARVCGELGWVNDPGGWDVNLTARPEGWVAEVGALSWRERFGALERRPWSTTPLAAETMVRMLRPGPAARVLDPCCGTGTLLVALGDAVPDAHLIGTDRDAATLALARRNLLAQGVSAELEAREAVPIRSEPGSLDAVVANLPFGKQVGSHDENATFYPALLHQVARALSRSGRAVLLTEDKGLLVDAVRRARGLRIAKERVLRYGGATPTAYLITRSRR